MKKISVSLLAIFAAAAVICAVWPATAEDTPGQVDINIPDINIKVPDINIQGIPGVSGSTQAGNQKSITGNHLTETIECKEEGVQVVGNHCTLTIKGACTGVQVMGNHNKIVIEKLPNLEVMGNNNDVTVETAGNISVMGNNNKLLWTKGIEADPNISNLGRDNVIQKSAQ